MTIIAPIAVDLLPPPPTIDDPDNFDTKADASVLAQAAMVPQINVQLNTLYNNALEAQTRALQAQQSANDAATSAAAAAASTTATKWVSGTTYNDGDPVWSPTSRFSYRHIGSSVSTIDPAMDSSTWVLQLYSLGLGGMVITGSVDLIATSGGAIAFTPSTPGLRIKLPDATTIPKGATAYNCVNNGVYDVSVINNTGTLLGFIRPNESAVIGLASSATAAGVWIGSGLYKLGCTAFINIPSVQGVILKRIALDTNRTLFLFGACYAVVYDASTQTLGTPTLVRSIADGTKASGILVATDKVLITTCDATTGMQSVILSVSGTAITPNSVVNSTAGSNVSLWGEFVSVGAAFAWSYVGSSVSYVRAITVSGTVPTIGTEATLSSTQALPILFVSGSTLRAIGYVSSSLACQPYTLSGANLIAGTPATGGSASPVGTGYKAFQNSNGNIVVLYNNASLLNAAVFKLTGTTEAMSVVAMSAFNVPYTTVQYVQISGTKTALAGVVSGLGQVCWNIHVDTSGTGSAGTEDSISGGSSISVSAVGVSGNNARFAVYSATDAFATLQLQFDCSGASPVRGNCQTRAAVNIPSGQVTGKDSRHFTLLSAGNNQYGISGSHAYDSSFNSTNVSATPTVGISYNAGAVGASPSESWLLASFSAFGAIGTTIMKVEAAA